MCRVPCHSPVSSGRRARAGSQHGSIPDLELSRRPSETAIWNRSVRANQPCPEGRGRRAEKRTPDAALTLLDEVAVRLRIRLDGHEACAEEVLPFWRTEDRRGAINCRHTGDGELKGKVGPLTRRYTKGRWSWLGSHKIRSSLSLLGPGPKKVPSSDAPGERDITQSGINRRWVANDDTTTAPSPLSTPSIQLDHDSTH